MLYSRWAYTQLINQINNECFTLGGPKLNQLINSILNLLLLGLDSID